MTTTTTKAGWSAKAEPVGPDTARVKATRLVRRRFGTTPVPAEGFYLVFGTGPATETFNLDHAERIAADIKREGHPKGYLGGDYRLDPVADTGLPGSMTLRNKDDLAEAEQAIEGYLRTDHGPDYRQAFRDALAGKPAVDYGNVDDPDGYRTGYRDGTLLIASGDYIETAVEKTAAGELEKAKQAGYHDGRFGRKPDFERFGTERLRAEYKDGYKQGKVNPAEQSSRF